MPFLFAVAEILDDDWCMSARGSSSVDADELNFRCGFFPNSWDCSRGRFRGLGDSGGSSSRPVGGLWLAARDLGDVKLRAVVVVSPGLL